MAHDRCFATFCGVLRRFAAFCSVLRRFAAFCGFAAFLVFCGALAVKFPLQDQIFGGGSSNPRPLFWLVENNRAKMGGQWSRFPPENIFWFLPEKLSICDFCGNFQKLSVGFVFLCPRAYLPVTGRFSRPNLAGSFFSLLTKD